MSILQRVSERGGLLALAAIAIVVLTGCRLDVVVDVTMEPDGTGVVVVDVIADADLVSRVPDLVDDLRLDDAIANGWAVDGPSPRQEGGATITLTHPFSSAAELTNLLSSVGPPLSRMTASRSEDLDGRIINRIDGVMVLPSGYQSFADADLLAAVGGLPFAAEIEASGSTVQDSFGFTYRVSLPGKLESAVTGTDAGDGTVEWTGVLDGTETDLAVVTVQQPPGAGSAWARPVATITSFVLVVWVVAASALIVVVALARRNRRRRREARLRRLR